MIIKAEQMEQFSTYMLEVFIKKTIVFLIGNFKEWAEGKDETALRHYIRSIMDLGKKYHVTKQINLQKLMHYHIEYKFDLPLHSDVVKILTQNKNSESLRIENLHRYLKSKVEVNSGTEL